MIPIFLALISIVGFQGLTVICAPSRNSAIYDQRQQGVVNVQISLEDVKIIALVESDMFDDYMVLSYHYFLEIIDDIFLKELHCKIFFEVILFLYNLFN